MESVGNALQVSSDELRCVRSPSPKPCRATWSQKTVMSLVLEGLRSARFGPATNKSIYVLQVLCIVASPGFLVLLKSAFLQGNETFCLQRISRFPACSLLSPAVLPSNSRGANYKLNCSTWWIEWKQPAKGLKFDTLIQNHHISFLHCSNLKTCVFLD